MLFSDQAQAQGTKVIAFDSAPTRYVKMQPARNRSRIANEIARIAPGGGTEIFPALDAAYQDMTVTQAKKSGGYMGSSNDRVSTNTPKTVQ